MFVIVFPVCQPLLAVSASQAKTWAVRKALGHRQVTVTDRLSYKKEPNMSSSP
jgi:hypothetical protein